MVEPEGVEGQEVEGNVEHDLDDVQDPNGRADLADPISGYDVTFKDDTGPGALTIQPLPSPKTSIAGGHSSLISYPPALCAMVSLLCIVPATQPSS